MRVGTWTVLAMCLMLGYQNCGPAFKPIQQSSDLTSLGDFDSGKVTCTNPDDVDASRNVRLAKHQLANTLTDLFGVNVVTAVQPKLELVPGDGGARNVHTDPNVTKDHVTAYVDVAFDVAAKVFANNTLKQTVFGACAAAATIPAGCIDTYLDGFATKIFRRPLNADEKAQAKAVYAKSADAKESLQNVLALHLSSTQFLIRWEFGDGADAKSVFKLTPFELASKIAFDLTDSTPDDQLLALAASGEITDEKTLRAEAKRLALTERGKYKIRQMFYSWLELREEFDFTNLGTEFVAGLNTAGLAKASLDEIDEFLNYVIFEQQGTYQDLMTSRLSFAKHTGLASIYGHAPVSTVPAVLSSGREGILSRLSYLFSSTPRSNIILRGVAFRRHVLCQNLPTPSQDVINSRNLSNLTEDQIEAMTTRNLVTHMTKEPQCISCHAGINPTGFAFEVFDSLGRLRNSEKIYDKNAQFVRTLPLNTSAEVPIWGGRTIAAENPTQLAEWVSNSPSGQACLAKNIYQFVQKRDAGERDGCHLNHTAEPLQTNGGSILDAFVNAAVNRGTQWKRIQ